MLTGSQWGMNLATFRKNRGWGASPFCVTIHSSYSATDAVGVSLITSTDSVSYGAVVYSTSLAREVPCRTTCEPSGALPGAGHFGGNSFNRFRLRMPGSTARRDSRRSHPVFGRGGRAGWHNGKKRSD